MAVLTARSVISSGVMRSLALRSTPRLTITLTCCDAVSGGSLGGEYSAPPAGTLLRWSARNRSLALAGQAATVRLWDAHAEMLHADIPTESEAAATSLWRGGRAARVVCGFGDGSVRAWDERSPRPLYSLHAHGAAVLCAAPRDDLHALITGAADGDVRLYDTRKLSDADCLRAPGPLAALDVHPRANVMAW